MGTNPARQGRRAAIDVADAAMLATAVIWAGNNVIVKAMVDTISPTVYVFCRFLFVVALVFAWMAARGGVPRIPRADWWRFALTGLSGYAVYNFLFTAGLKYTTAFSTAVLISLSPLMTMALAAALRIERTRTVQWIGLAVSTLGVVLYVSEKLREGQPARGDLLALLAAFSFAVYSVSTRPIVQRHGSLTVTAWSCLIGLVAITPFSIPALRGQDWGAIGVGGWAALLYSSAISMLLAYTIWGWAIERSGVGRTAPFLYLIPVITGVLSLFFLDEAFSLLKVAGALVVLVGVAVARSGAAVGWRAARARLALGSAGGARR